MKKFSIIFAAFLLFTTFGMAQAALEWEDPALCVEGQWLVIDAADPMAVKIALPQGTHYGDQAAGRCKTPAPAPLLPNSAVTVRGHGETMMVMIDGDGASSPVTVSYGGKTYVRNNHGETMRFKFEIDD